MTGQCLSSLNVEKRNPGLIDSPSQLKVVMECMTLKINKPSSESETSLKHLGRKHATVVEFLMNHFLPD